MPRTAAGAVSCVSPPLGGNGAASPRPTVPSASVTRTSTLRADSTRPVAMMNGSSNAIFSGSASRPMTVVGLCEARGIRCFRSTLCHQGLRVHRGAKCPLRRNTQQGGNSSLLAGPFGIKLGEIVLHHLVAVLGQPAGKGRVHALAQQQQLL